MAYDKELAERIRELISPVESVTEQRMFGGVAFLVDGKMAVAASSRGGLLVRVNQDEAESLVDGTNVVPMLMRGREMRDWLHVDSAAVNEPAQLELWVERGVTCARSLPPKRGGRDRPPSDR